MNWQYLLILAFAVLLLILLLRKRKQVEVQGILFPLLYFVMYRTKFGIAWMERSAKKFNRAWNFFFTVGVVLCFVGMAFICYEIFRVSFALFLRPEAQPGIMPVLPIEAKGVFFVPFIYWILSIFVIAFIHEFSHGIASCVHKLKVVSSGVAVLGVLLPVVPAAFVEPDETKIHKKTVRQQLSIFAAGPFSNIAFAAIVLLVMMFVFAPLSNTLFERAGAKVVAVQPNSPASYAGMQPDDVITAINDLKVKSVAEFSSVIAGSKISDTVAVETNSRNFTAKLLANPANTSQAMLGVSVKQHLVPTASLLALGSWPGDVFVWVVGLAYWLFLLSLGIGLFNLLPIGPLDGGRMLNLVLEKKFSAKGIRAGKLISFVFFALVIINIVAGFWPK
jgi:membrane-associated protease RseP (regulator of RpoE activity)